MVKCTGCPPLMSAYRDLCDAWKPVNARPTKNTSNLLTACHEWCRKTWTTPTENWCCKQPNVFITECHAESMSWQRLLWSTCWRLTSVTFRKNVDEYCWRGCSIFLIDARTRRKLFRPVDVILKGICGSLSVQIKSRNISCTLQWIHKSKFNWICTHNMCCRFDLCCNSLVAVSMA